MTAGKSLTAAVAMVSGLLIGCGGKISPPEPGDVEVSTATAGHDPDSDGYTAKLDGVRVSSIPADGQVRFAEVPAGRAR